MKGIATLVLATEVLLTSILLTACGTASGTAFGTTSASIAASDSAVGSSVSSQSGNVSGTGKESSATGSRPKKTVPDRIDYTFDGSVSEEVLTNYLAHSVTISGERMDLTGELAAKKFILDTGAKYICRAMSVWNPNGKEEACYAGQKAFIKSVHDSDPDVVFEACIFECVGKGVNEIPIPAFVFEAFGRTVEKRNFSFDRMRFSDGSYLGQWGEGTAVPDITRIETQMFFYYRAVRYIDAGFEGLHLGQIHLMGAQDANWACWTSLLNRIRDYAAKHAERHFVFLNAHTHGAVGTDGYLLFDFHMYPSRPVSDAKQPAHAPSAQDPQRAYFKKSYTDAIYGKSLGGKTHSGWETDTLPYLVELDNFGVDEATRNTPTCNSIYVWGMDEISWFANQPDDYRRQFLDYANKWVTSCEPGKSFFAMPCERTARIYRADGTVASYVYRGYASQNGGCGDQATVKAIWQAYDANFLLGNDPVKP